MNGKTERLNTALAGRYKIEKQLGQGGMATVYLAHDLKHDRKVAVKVLKPELSAVLGADRFVVEIKTTASLQHPHILPLFDSGTADGFLFYVMPYIEGETLRTRLSRETQLGVDESLRIAGDVADALDYAHRHGVIHRDIKPENILLHDGRPMVADFGIALAVSAAAGGRMTETGLSLGTPHYMSPEQATADKEITARSDVYSLASVLYEMLAGQPPHLGGSAQQIIMKIITESAPPVTTLRKSVPPNVAAALTRALEKVPADRFDSAKAFADALRNPAFGGSTTTMGAAAAQAAPSWFFSVRSVALVTTAALAVGVIGARLVWRGSGGAARTSRLMLQFPANQQPRYASLGPFPILAQAPGGTGLLYWGPGQSTRAQLMLRTWDRLPATRLSLPVDEGCCVVVSPGGDSLAFLTGPHALNVVAMSGGIPRIVADSGLTSVSDWGGGADWATDGRLYASGFDGLVRVPSRGGAMERVTALDAQRGDLRHMWPAVLPGSRAALVTVVPTKGSADPTRFSVGVADFRTGKVEILVQGLRAIYAPTGHLIVAKASGSLWAVPFDARSLRITGRERELPDTASANGAIVDLSLSPAGTLAYTKGVLQSLRAVWVTRTGEAQPVAADVAGEQIADPALSPDGKRMLFSLVGADGRSDIWVKSLDGSPKSRLTFDGILNNRASWRSGTSIVFLSDREKTGARVHMFERNADGSGAIRKPELHDTRAMGGHAFSPDGKWLIFRTDDQEPGNADIMGIRPGVDTVARPLVATAAEELAPAISPDGRWIAYSSNESGRREVWVNPFPETANARYQVSTTGGISPAWSPNGRELFFIDGADNMVSVPVTSGAAFQTGAAQTLFAMDRFLQNAFRRQYDVSPDGKRFLMLQGLSDGAVHVVVVFNFLDELKRLMAGQ